MGMETLNPDMPIASLFRESPTEPLQAVYREYKDHRQMAKGRPQAYLRQLPFSSSQGRGCRDLAMLMSRLRAQQTGHQPEAHGQPNGNGQLDCVL